MPVYSEGLKRRMNDDFDWVNARRNCSLAEVFETVKAQVGRDVETRNSDLLGKHFKFSLVDNGTSFSVVTRSDHPHAGKTVTFERENTNLVVRGSDGKVKFSATLTLSADRGCRFKIDDEEFDFWFIRKMALEDLFFWND